MMEIKQAKASSMKKGSYIIIEDEPSEVIENQLGKTSGRGTARCKIDAVGLISGKRRQILAGSTDNVQVPIIEKKTAQILSIQDNKINVMDVETFETFDLEIREDTEGTPTEGGQVVYWEVMGKKLLKQAK